MSSAYLCSVSIREKCVSLLRVDERKERQRITSKNRNNVYMWCHVFEKTLNSTNRAVAVATFGCPKGIPPKCIRHVCKTLHLLCPDFFIYVDHVCEIRNLPITTIADKRFTQLRPADIVSAVCHLPNHFCCRLHLNLRITKDCIVSAATQMYFRSYPTPSKYLGLPFEFVFGLLCFPMYITKSQNKLHR